MPMEDEIRTQRRKEAGDKKIFSKAEEIVKRRGDNSSYRHGVYHRYGFVENFVENKKPDPNGLAITLDTGGPNLWITWKGQEVYYYQVNSLNRYRPDIEGWESKLNEVYAELEPKIAAEEKAAQDKRSADTLRDWGIAPG